jgi:hypothetical protein
VQPFEVSIFGLSTRRVSPGNGFLDHRLTLQALKSNRIPRTMLETFHFSALTTLEAFSFRMRLCGFCPLVLLSSVFGDSILPVGFGGHMPTLAFTQESMVESV